MPVHHWNNVDANLFHHFRQIWSNTGLLPNDYSALLEPHDREQVKGKEEMLAAKGNRIAIRHRLDKIISIIEIVSPGNKTSQAAMRQFVDKVVRFVRAGSNVIIIDLLQPPSHNPCDLYQLVWRELHDAGNPTAPPHKPITIASYLNGGSEQTTNAFVEQLDYDEPLPDMPAFLDEATYIQLPLEKTYQQSWDLCPRDFKEVVEASR